MLKEIKLGDVNYRTYFRLSFIIKLNQMKLNGFPLKKITGFIIPAMVCLTLMANAQEKKPNILVIMGDDIGMWNIGAYHRGLMAGRTPNLDKIASEGMIFTDYYA